MLNNQEATLRWPCLVGTVFLLAGGTGTLLADPSPQATQSSTQQNETQRLQQYYEQQQANPTPPIEPLPSVGQDGSHAPHLANSVRFRLRQVDFTHSALLPQQARDDAVKPFVGREVNGADLAELLQRVNALYTQRKISTARAVFTRQSVTDGVLHIELVEGKLGALHIKGLHGVRDSFVRKRIDLKPNEVVDTNVLRDDLVYLNATTSLQAKALLEPGAERGQTDVLVDVTEPAPYSVDVFMDNNGVDSTGRFRVGVDAHLTNLFGLDDRLDGDIAHSSGANDGVVTYSIPLFTSNGRLEASYSHSQINIIDGAFRDLSITGHSSLSSLGYHQPLLASLHWQITGIAQYSIGDSTTNIAGQHIADTHTREASLGGSVQHQNDGETWSVSQLVTRLYSSEPMLGRSDFLIAPGSGYFIQRFGQTNWALRADAGWQLSSGKNLPSANLFQIGGVGSVRGYELGVVSGPRGYYVDLELHRNLFEHLDAYVFVDHGTIYSFYPSSKSITGIGPGVLYNYRSWLSLSADVAKSLDTVVAGQGSVRVDARLTLHWK